MGKGRLEAFSDGVLAIAITLLALELPRVSGEHLGDQLRHIWPSYFAYFVSFTVIGIMWVNHHALLQVVRVADRVLLLINLWLLAFIVLVPWTTNLVAENLRESGAKVAVAVYGANFVGTAIGFNGMWLWITRGPQLLERPDELEALRATRVRFGVGVGLYLLTVLIALVSPIAAMIGHALIALYYVADQLATSRTLEPDTS